MYRAEQVIQYLHNCYQSDNRELGLLNYFGNKSESKLLLDEPSIFSGNYPIYPVDPKWGEKAYKTLQIYRKEKELMLAYLFVTGQSSVGGKVFDTATPLFLIPSSLELNDESYYVRPAPESAVVNPSAIDKLGNLENTNKKGLTELQAWVNQGEFLFSHISNLRTILHQYFPSLMTDELLMYPELFNIKRIKGLQKNGKFHILPSAGLTILQKSTATMGVLDELNQLVQTKDYSSALKSYLGMANDSWGSNMPIRRPIVPATLSKSQMQVFKSVAQFPLSQVTGPPGTGKSFIIASLAADYVGKGKSVLIVSANDQAVDVIHQKIENDLELTEVAVRGGGKRDYKSLLKKRIQHWLSGIGVEQVEKKLINKLQRNLESTEKKLAQLEKSYGKIVVYSLKAGLFLTDEKTGWLKRIHFYYIQWRLRHYKTLWQTLDAYHKTLSDRQQKVRELLKKSFYYQLNHTLKTERDSISQFLSALKARSSSKKDSAFESINFATLSQALPVWLVSINDISRILPLKKELFDLVIIDEATQCDIASIIPVLQRAQKVAVAGDAKQLRHVCFLSKNKQQLIAHELGLDLQLAEAFDYRNKSVLDVINEKLTSQDAVVFLNEHYRSQPSIISYSNQHFYNNQLRVMTKQPQNEYEKHVYLKRVNGKKNGKGVNIAEADFILGRIHQIINSEAHLDQALVQSIGILSPFRQQVQYLQKVVEQEIDIINYERHQLLIGTPYAFQGEEKDIMFLSWVVDNESHPSTFQHLQKEDVFNVSVTRARSEQWNISSLNKPTGFSSAHMLENYLSFVEQDSCKRPNPSINIGKDSFLKEVTGWLNAVGVDEVHLQYPLAGLEVDIVLVYQNKTYCVDLVGYPGELEAAFSIEKCRILQRIGIFSFPLSYYQWQLSPEGCKKALKEFLGIE